MSVLKEADQVKLFAGIFSAGEDLIERAMGRLEEMFGPLDWKSRRFFFDRSRYYEKEMGWPLFRRLATFRNLIRPDTIVEVKLLTNELERAFAVEGKRSVNIDPGYICLERLVLVTGKNYTHRIYLSKGVYADLTLVFQRGRFTPLPWTYRDYGDQGMIEEFNEIRARYKAQLRRGPA